MSNAVASSGTSSGSETNRNSASGSRKRGSARRTRPGRCGTPPGSPTSPPHLAGGVAGRAEGRGEVRKRRPGGVALGRREVVARLDAAQLAAQPRQRAPPHRRHIAPGGGGAGRLGQGLVIARGRGGHAGGQRPLLGGGGRLGEPDRRLAAGVGDLVGQPLELLAVAGVQRQGDQPVEELRGAEAAQLAPHRDPRRGGLAGELVAEQDPAGSAGHGSSLAPSMGQRNRGYTVWLFRVVVPGLWRRATARPRRSTTQRVGCVNEFMQLASTYAGDRRAGRVGAPRLLDPHRRRSVGRVGPAPQAGAPGVDGAGCRVGPGRGARLSTSPFPRTALRTRRAGLPAPGSPRGPLPTNGCVDARLRSTRPGLPGRTPVFTGGSCPADTARSLAVPLRPVAGFPGPPTTTGTPPRPATNSGRRTCPPPEGGRAAMGRFPRSLPPGRRGRCPAIPRQPRQGYAAALLPGLLTGHYLPAPESLAATATGVHCTPAHIRQVGAGTSLTERQRWFLAYTFSSCLPDPARLAVPARPGVVRSAPTLPSVSTVRLPSAPPACCDRPAAGPFHPRPVVVAPRGAGSGPHRCAALALGGRVPRSAASPGTRCGPCRPSAPRRRSRWAPAAVSALQRPRSGRRRRSYGRTWRHGRAARSGIVVPARRAPAAGCGPAG